MRMVRRASFSLMAVVALAAAPAGAAAQFVPQLAPEDIGPQETLTFDGTHGETSFGVHVGPYKGTIGGTNVTLYCVDFLNAVSNGDTWTADIASMSLGGMATTRLGGMTSAGDALDRYSRAAWLASQFTDGNRSEWGGIHAAIWRIAVPGNDPPGFAWSGQGQSWFEQATALDLTTFDAQSWRVVSDVDEPGRQEYLVEVVPEPTAVVLLGTGLGALFLVGYRRRV